MQDVDGRVVACRRELAGDVAALFNLLTGASEVTGWASLTIAPTDLRQRFLDLIEREIQVSSPDRSGLIMAKVNSLQDEGICKALYRASRAGVKVLLNVRGICCLRPGVKGVSDTIEVRSIVDRYLEHARIFYFRNGGNEEIYLSSADWMTRNIDKRVETLFPVNSPALLRRLQGHSTPMGSFLRWCTILCSLVILADSNSLLEAENTTKVPVLAVR